MDSVAYDEGWCDGRFSPFHSFTGNPNLAAWEDFDRLSYYRGYRDGLRVREMLTGG